MTVNEQITINGFITETTKEIQSFFDEVKKFRLDQSPNKEEKQFHLNRAQFLLQEFESIASNIISQNLKSNKIVIELTISNENGITTEGLDPKPETIQGHSESYKRLYAFNNALKQAPTVSGKAIYRVSYSQDEKSPGCKVEVSYDDENGENLHYYDYKFFILNKNK